MTLDFYIRPTNRDTKGKCWRRMCSVALWSDARSWFLLTWNRDRTQDDHTR